MSTKKEEFLAELDRFAASASALLSAWEGVSKENFPDAGYPRKFGNFEKVPDLIHKWRRMAHAAAKKTK